MNSDDLMGSSHGTIVTAIYYRSKWVQHDINRIFHKRTKLAIMPIFVSDALLCKNKKNPVTKYYPDKILPPVRIEPGPLIDL